MEKSEAIGVCPELTESSGSKISSLSPRNIISALGCRFFNSTSQESTESKKTTVIHVANKKTNQKERTKKEERHAEKSGAVPGKVNKKNLLQFRLKEFRQKQVRHIDRDLRRFKAKYNSSIGNIVRDWMGLIYCILVLRMNLIKFILRNLSEQTDIDIHLHKQILLESKVIFNLIRDAQNSSQEKFLFLWMQLEKLIFNRKLFKSGLQMLQMKEFGLKDWKSADAKLMDLQQEFKKASDEYKAIQQSKLDSEITAKETMMNLEKIVSTKDAEYNELVEKIRELKKREVQMRGRILINMKSYKDLKAKKQKLLSVEEKMHKLKSEQIALTGEYNSKIQSLKKEIEENEKQIKEEKDEKKKIKARLEGFGDYSEKQVSQCNNCN